MRRFLCGEAKYNRKTGRGPGFRNLDMLIAMALSRLLQFKLGFAYFVGAVVSAGILYV